MNSFIAWIGGKRILAKTIISMMPEHHCYVEVFGGAGWVLFRKTPSEVEVWNDLNSDLVNLFRIVRNKLHVFKRRQYFLLSSREEYFIFQILYPQFLRQRDIHRICFQPESRAKIL